MLKKDLINLMSKKYPAMTEENVARLVNKIFDEIVEAMKQGKRVEIRGFGVFFCRRRSGYTLRSPRDGEMVEIAHKRIPRFKVGRRLSQKVNNVD